MKLLWTGNAWEDYLYWQKTDVTTLDLINKLIKDVRRDPFKGLGNSKNLCTAGGHDGLRASIASFIACLERTMRCNSKSHNADIIIDQL